MITINKLIADSIVITTGPELDEPLCFTAEQANSTVHLDKNGSPNTIYLETSTDGNTWTDYTWSGSTGDTLNLVNVGDKVYMRAKTENPTIGISTYTYYMFVMNGKIAASGNIQTLLKADGSRTDAPTYCYEGMFMNCSSLTTAPELLATTLASNCYEYMFSGCTSLTTAPELPATTLAENCYNGMFGGCSMLASIDVSFTAWNPSNATGYWVYGAGTQATGTKTFTCPSALPKTTGNSNIPTGWTIVEK